MFKVGLYSTERVVRALTGAVGSIIIARALGTGEMGKLALGWTLALILGPIATLSLESAIVTASKGDARRLRVLAGESFWLRLGLGFALSILGGIFTWLTMSETAAVLIVAVQLLSILASAADVFEQVLIAESRIQVASLFRILILFGGIVAKYCFVSTAQDTLLAAIILSVEALACGAVVSIIYFCRHKSERHADDPKLSVCIKSGLWGTVSGLTNGVQARIEQIFISKYLGAETFGLYYFALRICDTALLPFYAMCTYFANTKAAHGGNIPAIFPWARRLCLSAVLYVTLIAILWFIFGRQIVHLVLDYKWANLYPVVFMLMPRLLIACVGSVRQIFIIVAGKYREQFFVGLWGVCVAIPLTFIGISQFGLWGAVLGSFLSYFFTSFAIDYTPLGIPEFRYLFGLKKKDSV